MRAPTCCLMLAFTLLAAAGAAAAAPASMPAPACTTSGRWDLSSLPGHTPMKMSLWTSQTGASVTWSPAIDSAVRVRVSLYRIVHTEHNDRNVKVEIVHEGTTETLLLDCSQGNSGWAVLGSFRFRGGGGEFVRLMRISADSSITRASAVRFDLLAEGQDPTVIQSFTIDEVTAGPLATGADDGTLSTLPANPRQGPPASADARWQLTFEDEFEGEALDRARWDVEAGSPGHILSSRWPENVRVSGGILRLLTRKEHRGGREWTTGNIWSRSFKQQGGYFEARIRIGGASGLNNAFWLMTANKPADPVHFEIDICEAKYPNRINMALHNWAGGHSAEGKLYRASQDLSREFHVYGLLWTETELIWYLDGRQIHRVPQRICAAAPVRLSSAVGTFAGYITDSLDGTEMDVDWVRVYRNTLRSSAPEATAPAAEVRCDVVSQ